MKWEGLKSLGGVEIDQNGSEGVKQKDFLLVVVIQPSIIKQFEQMSTSLKLLKMCLSANVGFLSLVLENLLVLVSSRKFTCLVRSSQYNMRQTLTLT